MHMRKGFFLVVPVLLFCLSASATVSDGWVQWSSAMGGNDHYYQAVYTPQGITWQDAANTAVAMGGYLATVHSYEENQFIFSLITDEMFWAPPDPWNNREGPWLGGLRNPSDYGQWIWVTGEPWTYSQWCPGEPNNVGGNEDRLIFFGPGNTISNVWNDVGSGYGARGFVVESPVPEPATMVLLTLGGAAMLYRRRK